MKSPTVDIQIKLSKKEKEIFEILLNVVKHFKLNTTLRVAGGWVRDKLLKLNSDDIDIALDDCMGIDFAQKVNEYLTMIGEEQRTVAEIKQNPEQSKHLDTARVKLKNQWIDFVNLRTEIYESSTRIPVMEMGTPEEDAFRRDLTINALFYNINNGTVEDFTGGGIRDLKNRTIRTPREPIETLMDDPLRVLRAIRFAAKYGFHLDEALLKAASLESVQDSFAKKISRERVGKELSSIMSLKEDRILFSLKLLYDISFLGLVFSLPSSINIKDSKYQERSIVYLTYACKAISFLKTQPEQTPAFLLSSLFLPIYEYTYAKNGKQLSVIHHIIAESIKWPLRDFNTIQLMTSNSNAAFELLQRNSEKQASRKDVGLFLRNVGSLWKEVLVLSMISHLPFPEENLSSFCKRNEIWPRKNLDLFYSMVDFVLSQKLDGVWEMKPLLNGKQIARLFEKPTGPWVGKMIEKLIEWQLEHPEKDEEECKVWLMSQEI